MASHWSVWARWAAALLIGAAVAAKSLIATEPELAGLLEKVEPVPVEKLPHAGTFWLLKKDEPVAGFAPNCTRI